MFCNKCGKEIHDEAVICVNCGCSVGNVSSNKNVSNEKAGGMSILSFLIPLVGLILYLVWKDTKPVAAKQCGKSALWGVGVGIVLYIISMVVLVATIPVSPTYYY